MIVAGLRMKRLEAYSLAITGSILAILITPGNLIGLPIGIWSLVVLSRREVREAFAKTQLLSLEAAQAKRGGFGWKAALAVMIVLIIAVGALLAARFLLATKSIAPPAGLVAWWPLEGHATDAVGNHNGALEGSFLFVPSEVGRGIHLEGPRSGISVPDSPDLNFGPDQDFSIEAWIQPLPWQSEFGVMDIVDKRDAPNLTQSHGYAMAVRNGKLCFLMADSLEGAHLNWEQNGPDLRDGLWHHVAVSVKRTSATGVNLYVDGQVIASFDPTPARGDLGTRQPLLIGMHQSYPWFQGNFRGGIDEVSLYKRALSPAEIQDIYSAGKNGKGKPHGGLAGILAPNRDWQETGSMPAEAAVDLGGGIQMEFVLIRPGSFRMGSDLGDEAPARDVTITEPFYLGKYEVTQEQWEAVMGTNPSYFKGPKLPVDNVSADDAQDFLTRVREKTGRTLALPTEAQWEYACRAGTITRYSFGDSPASLQDYAWFADNSGGITHPVGEKKPNRWGLYDMHGNVWERCTDGNNFHMMRGGAYSLQPNALRASNRAEDSRGYSRVGLRCVLVDKSGFAGQTKTPEQELAKDDGSSAGKTSEGGSGHAVRFEAPSKNCYLTAVRIFGSRYGHPQPPRENASVWLCDTSFKKIAEFAAPYSYFVRGGPRWVTIPVRPTKVPLDFIVCVAFNPTATKGVYVHYDSGGSGSSFLGLPGGMGQPFGEGDWLIRAVVREENTQATQGTSGFGRVATGVAGTPKPPLVMSGRKRETSPSPAEDPAIREDIDKDIPLAEALRRANQQFPDAQPLTEEEVIAAVRNIKQKHPDIPEDFYRTYQRVVNEHILPRGMYFSQIRGWQTELGHFDVDWKDLTLITLPVGSKGPCFNYRIRARFISSQ